MFGSYEFDMFSWDGSDGIIQQLLRLIEPVRPIPKFCVEIGAYDGLSGSPTRNLIVNHDWHGLMVEGDKHRYEQCAKNCRGVDNVFAVHERVVPCGIDYLLMNAGIPEEFGVFVLDIDNVDYWVWKCLIDHRPLISVMEYNAHFKPDQLWVYPYWEPNERDGAKGTYYGASLLSLVNLSKKKGYSLAYCDSQGANAFFIRTELYSAIKEFDGYDNSPATLYVPRNPFTPPNPEFLFLKI